MAGSCRVQIPAAAPMEREKECKGFHSSLNVFPRRGCPRKGIFEGQPVSFEVPNPTGSTRCSSEKPLGKERQFRARVSSIVEIMVVCDGCGKEYSSGIVVKKSSDIVLEGNTSQCPNCGRVNPIDDRHIRKA